MTSSFSAWYEAREHMVRAMEHDLLGADGEDITEPPLDRFIVGVLHPLSAEAVEDNASVPEDAAGTAPDAEADPGVSFSRARYPSSMGMTFALDRSLTSSIGLRVQATRYEQQLEDAGARFSSPAGDPTIPAPGSVSTSEAGRGRGTAPKAERWEAHTAKLTRRQIDVCSSSSSRHPVADGLEARVLVRPARRGVVRVTVTLINTARRPGKGRADSLAWFRPSVLAQVEQGRFVEGAGNRASASAAERSEDEQSGDLLYRDVTALAVGHGCAVDWTPASEVTEIFTTFIPSQAVLSSRADREDLPPLGMTALASDERLNTLDSLCASYRAWIRRQEDELPNLSEDLRSIAARHLVAARSAADRIEGGVALIKSDDTVATAFRVMNRVMQDQRARQDMIRSGAERPSEREQYWRPFQLAFILLNLKGLAEPADAEREIADVLWFPTGGGKTEAYLGLIAFIVTLRRLRAPEGGGGVAVIMRYTLRLLTVQQFERASALICALELWRREAAPSSDTISIGLWVGQATTPNNVSDARRVLSGHSEGAGTPRQLLRCPWCGSGLPLSSYRADVARDRLTVDCPNPLCDFHDGLPLHVVDSDVYREQPSLVIGTVDKFAQLPLNEKAGRLFGDGEDVAPPDLIIQDELHLISGPLGTLVGLYETVVDELATGTSRPKVIASTATIRRAADQVRKVFARDSAQFPPPGLDARDSFFSVQAPPSEKADRLYVGVMAPGTSHATLMVRTYSALLQAAASLSADPAVRDAYWTLLGYFNSLRVLGSAFMQTVDDVPDRLKVVAARSAEEPRAIAPPRELTSRKSATEIPEELDALGTSLPDPSTPDVVLATNMISVGVDVERLGLMAVMGQPQTTSEYIQATSRVGRRFPGLVVTIFNSTRSRDISHYEQFVVYHRALYKHVEATGATPFAARALDRGLHGVLTALIRHTVPGAAGDTAAAKALIDESLVERVANIITKRTRAVQPEAESEVEAALERLVTNWRTSAEMGITKHYMSWRADPSALMVPAGGEFDSGESETDDYFPVHEPSWPTLTSLRNVDAESGLFLARTRRRNGDD